MRAGVEIEHEFEHVFAIGDAHEDDVEGAVVEFGARGGEGGLRAPRDVERPHTEDVAGDAAPPGTIGEADAEVGVGECLSLCSRPLAVVSYKKSHLYVRQRECARWLAT